MFTIGADPEFMLMDASGKMRSAIGVIPGTKKNRHKFNGHEFYYDNVLAEIAVRPASSKNQFIESLEESFKYLSDFAGDCSVVAQAACNFDKSELQHPDANEGGCEEEFCAYLLRSESVSDSFFIKNKLRTAGGHIHIGTDVIESEIDRQFVARMLDLFVGIPSVCLDQDPTSIRRRKLYGKAGRYRDPDYGIEYRSLGNFWLSSPKLVSIIYDLVEFVIDFVSEGRHFDFWTVDFEAIDNDDNYNQPGWSISDAHVCFGYDSVGLQKSINSGKLDESLLDLVNSLLPNGLSNKLSKAMEYDQFNLEDEWDL